MNLQSLIVVVLRLIAIDFFLRSSVFLFPTVLSMLKVYDNASIEQSRAEAALPWLLFCGLVVCAVLLWLSARFIARLVTRNVASDISFGAMSLADCYSVAFIGVGLFYITSHLPQALNWCHYLFKAAASGSGEGWKDGVDFYQVSQALIPLILGIVLFANGRTWALSLAKKQQVDPIIPNV